MAVMDDALMSEALLPAIPEDWQEALTEIATRTHGLFLRHPWALSAMLTAPPGLNAMRHMEQCLQALAKTRMTNEEKLTLLAMVDDFVFGHALREAADDTKIDSSFAEAQMATGDFPQLEEVFREGRKKRWNKGQRYREDLKKSKTDRFQIGLRALLEGKRSWAK
jgi:Tetracyclin repressor-like, C-terminal domain